jgi:2-(1,2-epoxy-1,2-dihydrophenyl)acetyl-CoA isomerase
MTEAQGSPTIDTRRHGAIGVLTLDRPDRLNALSHDLLSALRRQLMQLEQDDSVRAIVLTGRGRAFSSGADLRGPPSDAEDVVRRLYNPLVSDMRNARTPLIAAINGVSAGAAVALALACDLRIADEDAYFQVSFTKVGLVPDAGLTWLLPRAIGSTRAMEMAMLAQRVDASKALDWGLVNEVSPRGGSLARALEVAENVAKLSSDAVGMTRNLLWSSASRSLEEQLDHEATNQGIAQHGEDFAEVRAAFRENRKPDFNR